MEIIGEVTSPTIHCSACGINQFHKEGRTKCLRCHQELKFVELPHTPPTEQEIKPEERTYPYEEYVKRLEDQICLTLKRLRKRSRLSQRKTAEMCGFGSRSYISKLENPFSSNRTIPTIKSLERFSSVFKIGISEIMAMSEKKAGKAVQDEWTEWWTEMALSLKSLQRKDWFEVLAIAHSLHQKTVASERVKR